MKLSVLIPTHSRPSLFTRCLKSVIDNNFDDVEIIVNNDSSDITEIPNDNITYYYEKFENLSQIYQFLLSKASGEYVYFLEDDDFLVPNIQLPLTADVIVGNYAPTYDPPFKLPAMTHYKNGLCKFDEFKAIVDLELLQLSQFVFRRDVVADFKFPMDNNIHNDINLVLHACSNSQQIQMVNRVLFFQTQDGGDNISFPESTSTINISKYLDFLDQYAIQNTKTHTTGP